MPTKQVTPERYHALDAARAIMLLLGIPFHIAEMYRISGGYSLDAEQPSWAASLISALIHSFRMPGFYFLSGFFAAMLLARKDARGWLASRFKRLGIPLLASLLTFGFLETVAHHAGEGQPWKVAFISAISEFPFGWVNHRWFLIVLLIYCSLIALVYLSNALRSLIVSRYHFVVRAMNVSPTRKAALHVLVILTLLLWPFAAIAMKKVFGDGVLAFYVLLGARYAPFFALGICAYLVQGIRNHMFRPSRSDFLITFVLLAIYLGTYFAFYRQSPVPPRYEMLFKVVQIGSETITGYFATRLFFFFMFRFFNDSNQAILYFVSASFVMYLVHEVFFLFSGVYLKSVHLDPVLEMLALNVVTLVGCIGTFEIVRRVRWLTLLMNGGPISPPVAYNLLALRRR